MDPAEFLLLVVIIAIVAVALLIQHGRLTDPNDDRAIYTEQLPSKVQVREGPVSVLLFRQSGNLYRDLGEFGTVEDGANALMKSLNRGKIVELAVLRNDSEAFEVVRIVRSGRKNEGKKLGGGRIVAIQRHVDNTRTTVTIPGLSTRVAKMTPIPGEPGSYDFKFEFHCEDCGGYKISVPDDRGNEGMVTCTACGREFGTFGDVKRALNDLGKEEVRRLEDR